MSTDTPLLPKAPLVQSRQGTPVSWPDLIVQCLKTHEVRFVSYVPDVIVHQVLECMEREPSFRVIPTTREEEAIGIASGAYLGNGRGAVFMQSSGFGNCLNALGSLNLTYRIPVALFISARGRLGEFNLAQVPLGRAVTPILEALGIQHFHLTAEADVLRVVDGGLRLCFAARIPVALVLSPLLTGGKHG